MTTIRGQLAFDLNAAPAHRPGVDLDSVAFALRSAQERALTEAWRAQRRPAPCACPKPMVDGDEARCLKCGRRAP